MDFRGTKVHETQPLQSAILEVDLSDQPNQPRNYPLIKQNKDLKITENI